MNEKQSQLLDDIIRLSMELQDKLGRFDATFNGYGLFYRWDNVVSNITRIASRIRKMYENEIR